MVGWMVERIVRMLKEVLRRVLGKSIVNYEELLAIICDCESIINARPLTYIHEDPNELLPLSPEMFILGNSNCETPDLDRVDRSSLVKCTKYLQKLREDLRQRFRNEYLALLVHRGTRRTDALEVYPGQDGVPRVARIRTSHGLRKSLPFEKTPESSTDHVSDSPTDYVPDSPVENTDNSEEKPPTKTPDWEGP
ncbi:DUF5641 domain-containing protein [Trichonephila clavipes]|nr:DUF5641 domain-containing protein [Trichonephila clavipes]